MSRFHGYNRVADELRGSQVEISNGVDHPLFPVFTETSKHTNPLESPRNISMTMLINACNQDINASLILTFQLEEVQADISGYGALSCKSLWLPTPISSEENTQYIWQRNDIPHAPNT